MTRPFCWWPGGVPDSVRSAMLIYCPPVTAPVVEHINNALNTGCLKSQDVTIPLLQELNTRLGWGLARNTITRFFDSPMNRIFFTKLAGDSVSRTKAKVTIG